MCMQCAIADDVLLLKCKCECMTSKQVDGDWPEGKKRSNKNNKICNAVDNAAKKNARKKLIASDNYHRVNAKILNYCTNRFCGSDFKSILSLSLAIDFNILEHFFAVNTHIIFNSFGISHFSTISLLRDR